MNRYMLKGIGLLSMLFSISCDSGDIFSTGDTTSEGVSVRGTFELLNMEVFPQKYDMIFGAFGQDEASALSSVNVLKPSNMNEVELSIDNVPENAVSVKLCLTNSGRQVVYTFFEYALDDDRTSDIDLPVAQIDLLEYDRIQRLVFQQYNCVSCHQGAAGASDLLLTDGESYKAMVNIPSVHSDKFRVKPGDSDNSFLLDVLTDDNVVSYPHTGLVTRSEDIDMLRIWIEKGCPQN